MNATTLWQACAAVVAVVQEREMDGIVMMRKILVALMLTVLPLAGLTAVAAAAATPQSLLHGRRCLPIWHGWR